MRLEELKERSMELFKVPFEELSENTIWRMTVDVNDIVHHSAYHHICSKARGNVLNDYVRTGKITDKLHEVNCSVCQSRIEMVPGTTYYTIDHLGHFSDQVMTEKDLINYARDICGIKKKRIEKFLADTKSRPLHTTDWVIRKLKVKDLKGAKIAPRYLRELNGRQKWSSKAKQIRICFFD